MNRLFRTFLIFLFLLSARTTYAQPTEQAVDPQRDTEYSQHNKCKQLPKKIDQLVSNTYSPPFQTYSTLTELYACAPDAQQELAFLLQHVSLTSHSKMILAPIKEQQRAQEKIIHKLNNNPKALTDIVRGTIAADSLENLMQAYAVIATNADIVKVKNRFTHPKASGYRDINVLVKLPKSAFIAEIQLHLTEIAAIKSGAEHKIYETIQQIERSANNESRQLTELEVARIQKMRQESHKLYHKAWLSYKRQDEYPSFAEPAMSA